MARKPCAIVGSTIGHGSVTGTFAASIGTKTKALGIPIIRFGDLVTCSTHGPTTVSTASTTVKDYDTMAVAREGDLTACGATITIGSGSPTRLISD